MDADQLRPDGENFGTRASIAVAPVSPPAKPGPSMMRRWAVATKALNDEDISIRRGCRENAVDGYARPASGRTTAYPFVSSSTVFTALTSCSVGGIIAPGVFLVGPAARVPAVKGRASRREHALLHYPATCDGREAARGHSTRRRVTQHFAIGS